MMINTVENKKRQANILLVEDNRGDVVLAERAFKSAKTSVRLCSANSAEQALFMLRTDNVSAASISPDLILLDLNLPQMDGHDFLKIVKADPLLKHIPVIVLSSSRAKRDVVYSYNQYASGYIVKPLGLKAFEYLVSTIEQFFFTLVLLPDAVDIDQSKGAL